MNVSFNLSNMNKLNDYLYYKLMDFVINILFLWYIFV